MKYARFQQAGGSACGILDAEGTAILPLPGVKSLHEVIADPQAPAAHARHIAGASASDWLPLASVRLCAPIVPHRNVFCVGKNYRAHAIEFHRSGFDTSATASSETPDAPIIFTKAPSSVIGPHDPVPLYLDDTQSTDYEGELAVVIGKGGRAIAVEDALDHVFGYSVINDVTARHLQQRHRQWFLGKSIDGYGPLGPVIVTRDAFGPPADQELRTYVDGALRQRSQLRNMIFDVPTLIAEISRRITLEPGDVIATGTPEGVGIGVTPPVFLTAGQTVRVEIDGIGAIENVMNGTPSD